MGSTLQEIQEAFSLQNYELALSLGLPDLARRGNREAQEMLGNCYELGLGMPQDIAQAVFWYETAIANGSGLAANNLSGIVCRGYGDNPPDRVLAQSLLEKAHELGFDHAPLQLLS